MGLFCPVCGVLAAMSVPFKWLQPPPLCPISPVCPAPLASASLFRVFSAFRGSFVFVSLSSATASLSVSLRPLCPFFVFLFINIHSFFCANR